MCLFIILTIAYGVMAVAYSADYEIHDGMGLELYYN